MRMHAVKLASDIIFINQACVCTSFNCAKNNIL